jgi:hypothetical protein
MALPFVVSDAALLTLQAACVAAPKPPPRVKFLERFHGPGWALVPIGSIVVVIFAIRYVNDTATALTYLALIAVPPLAAAALGWAARGSRPWAALGAIPLFVLAWASRDSLAGHSAAAILSALSCVTLGVLLGAVTPPSWLKVGIVAMAIADSWLVISDLLQAPNATLLAAAPGGGLPRLQSLLFGSGSMGYGDVFVAGVLGAVLAREGVRRQLGGAVMTLVFAGLFDLLFFVVDELPATVPVAATVIVLEAAPRVRRLSASRRRSRPEAATPRRAT